RPLRVVLDFGLLLHLNVALDGGDHVGDAPDDQETRIVTHCAPVLEDRPCNAVGLHINCDGVRVEPNHLALLVMRRIAQDLLAGNQATNDHLRGLRTFRRLNRDLVAPQSASPGGMDASLQKANRWLVESDITLEVSLGSKLSKLPVMKIIRYYYIS